MSLRLPLQTIGDFQDNGLIGVSSVNGGIAHNFYVPQDADNILIKLQASIVGGGVSTVLQTTDDGGVTWYDVARTSVVSNTGGSIFGGGQTLAEWISAPVIGYGVNPQVISTVNAGSVLGGTVGSAGASTLGSRQVSGLPIMGVLNRVFTIVAAGTTGVASVRTQIKVNNQSNRA